MNKYLFKLLRPMLAVLFFMAIAFNTIAIFIPILILAAFKALPFDKVKKSSRKYLSAIAVYWVSFNNFIVNLMTTLEITPDESLHLSKDKSYIVIANHQSWLDIVILQRVLHKKAPALKFFIKDELKWVPVLGICWWALDFPFMKRYSKYYLAKHPEKKGQNLIATKKACHKFKELPVSIMNFPEGTRFTKEKYNKQNSAYENFLRPKAGGLAYVMAALGDSIDSVLDVTIAYPTIIHSVWDLFCGRVPEVKVHIKQIAIPTGFYTLKPYQTKDMKQFQAWLNEVWSEKDHKFNQLKLKA